MREEPYKRNLSGYTNKNSPAVAISAGLWYIIDKESAVRQTVSTFPASYSQRMTAQVWTLRAVIFCV